MNDTYPSTLNIEIDRDRLRKYLRVKDCLQVRDLLADIDRQRENQ